MTGAGRAIKALAVGAAALLSAAACSPPAPAAGGFDRAALTRAVEQVLGGPDTCVILMDQASGAEVYMYGTHGVCMRRLPPCATFEIVTSLIALETGAADRTTPIKWDGGSQPVKAWETDADITTAFKRSILWWHQRVARQVGQAAMGEALAAYDYGDEDADGALDGFWLGAGAGGLGISTREQAGFLRRLYSGALPVQADTAAFVQGLMLEETIPAPDGPVTLSGKVGACDTQSDGSRGVSWWVGALNAPDRALVFAASIEAAAPPPGVEVRRRIKAAFVRGGVLPAPQG